MPSVNAQQKKSPNPPPKKPECLIKGNISVSSGKKWYHLPGMEDYEKTRIDPLKGEKWFCTEEEARKNFHNFIVGKKDNEQKSFFNAIIV